MSDKPNIYWYSVIGGYWIVVNDSRAHFTDSAEARDLFIAKLKLANNTIKEAKMAPVGFCDAEGNLVDDTTTNARPKMLDEGFNGTPNRTKHHSIFDKTFPMPERIIVQGSAERLAEAHVNWFLNAIKPLLLDHFIHGFKHGEEAANAKLHRDPSS